LASLRIQRSSYSSSSKSLFMPNAPVPVMPSAAPMPSSS
jgi:hypothetical protein